jgi:hypothetical protein
MSEESERTTVGATETGRHVMKWLKEEGVFPAEMDVYRFAIALGVSLGRRTPLVGRTTSFNVGSFDADGSVAALVQSMISVEPGQVYRAAEELAETGFAEMNKAVQVGEFRFEDMLETARRAAARP